MKKEVGKQLWRMMMLHLKNKRSYPSQQIHVIPNIADTATKLLVLCLIYMRKCVKRWRRTMQTHSFSLPRSIVINCTNGLLARFLDIVDGKIARSYHCVWFQRFVILIQMWMVSTLSLVKPSISIVVSLYLLLLIIHFRKWANGISWPVLSVVTVIFIVH